MLFLQCALTGIRIITSMNLFSILKFCMNRQKSSYRKPSMKEYSATTTGEKKPDQLLFEHAKYFIPDIQEIKYPYVRGMVLPLY